MDSGALVHAIQLLLPLGLIGVAFCSGTIMERRHYRSIRRREQEMINIPLVNSKEVWGEWERSCLVCGSVVLAADHFKVFLGSLRNLVGGSMTTFESLVDRARREAILRMKETARTSDGVFNVRVETSRLGAMKVEVVAYGTAVYGKKHGV